MEDQGGKFSFSQGIHARIDIGIDISISVRPMTNILDKEVHLEGLIQMKLIKQVIVTESRQGHVTNQKHFISPTRVATKLGRMGTYPDGPLSMKLREPLIT